MIFVGLLREYDRERRECKKNDEAFRRYADKTRAIDGKYGEKVRNIDANYHEKVWKQRSRR